jgi:histone H3/H4
MLKITVPAVRELCRQRTQVRSRTPLPAIRIHKKAIRFDRQAVEAWLSDIASTAQAKGGL